MKRPTLPRAANTRAGRLTALREAKDIAQDDVAAALEISQLLYHLQVLMISLGLDLDEVYAHL